MLQDPLLQKLAVDYQKLIHDTQALTDGLSPDQLNWKPDAKSWSIAQVIRHNHICTQVLLNGLKAQPATPPKGVYSHKFGWFSGYIFKALNKPSPVPTTKALTPSSSNHGLEIVPQYIDLLEQVRRQIPVLDGCNLMKMKSKSPALSWITYTLIDALLLDALHNRRHLGQIERLKARPEFPKN